MKPLEKFRLSPSPANLAVRRNANCVAYLPALGEFSHLTDEKLVLAVGRQGKFKEKPSGNYSEKLQEKTPVENSVKNSTV